MWVDVLITVVVLAMAGLAIWALRRQKMQGRSHCGGCPYAGTCHGTCEKNTKK